VRVFIDSNIPMYVAGADHPNRAAATRLLERVRAGEIEGCTSTEVLQEILYRYLALARPDAAFAVYDAFTQMCSVIFPVTLADTDRARRLIEEQQTRGVRDAIHAAVMLNNDVPEVATFDRAFDGIPGVHVFDLS